MGLGARDRNALDGVSLKDAVAEVALGGGGRDLDEF
jgi:hypothetical protein